MALRFLRTAPARFGLALSLLLGHAAAAAEDGPAASQAAPALQPALYDVTVNGQAGSEPALFLRDRDGRLYVGAALLRAWRIRIPAAGATSFEGELYYPTSVLPGLRLAVAEQTQSVAIDADAGAFERQNVAFGDPDLMPMTAPTAGAFLNYDLFVDHVGGDTAAAGAFETGIFTRHGAGTMTFIASAGGGQTRATRLETTWTIDRPSNMTSIRIGDSISSAGPGAAPFRFAGVQYARNFAVQPGYLTMPLPVASGSAAVPSVVDVYVNSTLQGQRQVSPGPFELSNVPVPSGGGTVQLVVRDLLGREIVTEQGYYASTQLLRRGLRDFSYEAGFLREDFGRRSNRYGSFFASTTQRYGFTDKITGEAIVQASRSRQMAGVAITAVAFDLAQIGGSVSVSHSDRGTGFRAAASVERRGSGFSFGLIGDYVSRDYATIGVPDDKPPPRYTLQAFADLPLPRGGIGFNLVHRSIRAGPDETLAGAFATWRVSGAVSLQVYARHAVFGEGQTSFGAHLAVAFGGRSSASASFDGRRDGSAGYISYQHDPPPGLGGGFRATARIGESSGGQASYVHNFSLASVSAQASYARGTAGVRLSATGAIGFMGGRAFASRSLGGSFASVRLAGFPGVRVYADNRPVGVTDKSGFIVVPGLNPFERNTIRIEQADLPLDATLTSEEVAIRPFARAGTVVRFDLHRERGALLGVRLEDGTSLPAGAIVRIEGRPETYVAVSGGQVYVPNLTGTAQLRAQWGDRTCRFTAAIPAGNDPQPRLDGLVCSRSPDYAAR